MGNSTYGLHSKGSMKSVLGFEEKVNVHKIPELIDGIVRGWLLAD